MWKWKLVFIQCERYSMELFKKREKRHLVGLQYTSYIPRRYPTKCKQSLHQNILMQRNAYILFLTITPNINRSVCYVTIDHTYCCSLIIFFFKCFDLKIMSINQALRNERFIHTKCYRWPNRCRKKYQDQI